MIDLRYYEGNQGTFPLDRWLGSFYNKPQILPNLIAEAMRKSPCIFFALCEFAFRICLRLNGNDSDPDKGKGEGRE